MRATDPDRVIREVGRRVAELRTAARMTQEALAEKLRVSLKYVQRIESGVENLTLRSLVRLANTLEAQLTDLVLPPSKGTRRPRMRRVVAKLPSQRPKR